LSWYDVAFEANNSINTNYSKSLKNSPYQVVFSQFPPQFQMHLDVDEIHFYDGSDYDDELDENVITSNLEQANNVVNLLENEGVEGNTHSESETEKHLLTETNEPIEEKFDESDAEIQSIITPASISAPSSQTDQCYTASSLTAPLLSSFNGDSLTSSSSTSRSKPIEIVASIRSAAASSIENSVALMKQTYERQHAPKQYKIGEIVGAIIPKEYRLPNHTKLLPAIIIGYQKIEDVIYYELGVKEHILKGKFHAKHITNINASVFAAALGIYDVEKAEELCAYWGRRQSGFPREKLLLDAYYDYISFYEGYSGRNASESLSQSNSSSSLMISESPESISVSSTAINSFQLNPASVSTLSSNPPRFESPPILSNSTSADSSALNKTTAALRRKRKFQESALSSSSDRCYVCDNPFRSSEDRLRCCNCFKEMHTRGCCEFGWLMEYKSLAQDELCCSAHCANGTEIYEEEIVDHDPQKLKYKIRYNSGTTQWISQSKVEVFSHYSSILRKYYNKRKRDTQNATLGNQSCMHITFH
jgi:hypothetical protein